MPGIKVHKIRKLLIAVDTSGSINREEMATFFNEVYHIWRQGTEIEVVECDTKIHRTYSFKGKPPEFVLGRGGTDFNAPIQYGNTVRPGGLIYFTDGFAPPPTTKGRMPILWVIASTGLKKEDAHFEELPGRKAKLNNINFIHPDFDTIGKENHQRLYWKVKNNPISKNLNNFGGLYRR